MLFFLGIDLPNGGLAHVQHLWQLFCRADSRADTVENGKFTSKQYVEIKEHCSAGIQVHVIPPVKVKKSQERSQLCDSCV